VQHFTYVGEDCIEVFLKKVQSVASQLRKMIKDAVPLDPASVPPTHEHAKQCHICHNVLHAGFDAGTLTPAQERVYDLHRARFKVPDGTPLEPTPASIAELIAAGADATVAKQLLYKREWIKVADHDHWTGAYLGPAHNRCNRERTIAGAPIPCLFHNGIGYDFHMLGKHMKATYEVPDTAVEVTHVDERTEEEEEEEAAPPGERTGAATSTKNNNIDIIALNHERFLSVRYNNVVFKDSCQFLQGSLDTAVKNMAQSVGGPRVNMSHTTRRMRALMRERGVPISDASLDDALRLMAMRKGVYPYSLVKSEADFATPGMWPREALDDDVLSDRVNAREKIRVLEEEVKQGGEGTDRKRAQITQIKAALKHQRRELDADYEHAQRVWEFFRCRTFEDYHRLYLEADGVLLLDAMETFRQVALSEDKLDPLHFYGVPRLTYASML
jgi:hypothetical protein